MPTFLYFDLGRVLVDFDLQKMYRQMADVAGIAPAAVEAAIMESGLQWRYEAGRISTEEFYEDFCRRTGARADFASLAKANREIFRVNDAMERLIRRLHAAGVPLGVLSNTGPNHWEHCCRQYPAIGECFGVHVLSYRVGVLKPDAAIFRAAAAMAGHAPGDTFFTDDIAEHVAAARDVGFDAVQFTSAPQLVAELRQRGVEAAG